MENTNKIDIFIKREKRKDTKMGDFADQGDQKESQYIFPKAKILKKLSPFIYIH